MNAVPPSSSDCFLVNDRAKVTGESCWTIVHGQENSWPFYSPPLTEGPQTNLTYASFTPPLGLVPGEQLLVIVVVVPVHNGLPFSPSWFECPLHSRRGTCLQPHLDVATGEAVKVIKSIKDKE